MNKVWTILDGAIDTPVFGDYRRLTETSDLGVSVEAVNKAKTIFSDNDPHIRGYIVEAVVQAALKSNYRDMVLSFDTLNTYDIPLNPNIVNTLKSKNGTDPINAVFSFKKTDPGIYMIDGSIDRYENVLVLTANSKTKDIPVSIDVKITPDISILYSSLNDVKDTIFTAYRLPILPPLTIFYNRLKQHFPALTTNTDAIASAGKFIEYLLTK